MYDSDGASIYSDAETSEVGTIFSDASLSSEDELPKVSQLEITESKPTAMITPTVNPEPIRSTEKMEKSPTKQRKSRASTTGSLCDVTQRILARRNASKDDYLTTGQNALIEQVCLTEVPRKRAKKASTPIRNRISTLERQSTRKTATTFDVYMKERRETEMRERPARRSHQEKAQTTPKVLREAASVGDENDVNVFEMTLAEGDRQDQKKRHRLFLEKFEKISS